MRGGIGSFVRITTTHHETAERFFLFYHTLKNDWALISEEYSVRLTEYLLNYDNGWKWLKQSRSKILQSSNLVDASLLVDYS